MLNSFSMSLSKCFFTATCCYIATSGCKRSVKLRPNNLYVTKLAAINLNYFDLWCDADLHRPWWEICCSSRLPIQLRPEHLTTCFSAQVEFWEVCEVEVRTAGRCQSALSCFLVVVFIFVTACSSSVCFFLCCGFWTFSLSALVFASLVASLVSFLPFCSLCVSVE